VGTAKRERQKTNRQQRLDELQRQQRRDRTKRRILTWGAIIIVAGGALFLLARLTTGGDDNDSAVSATTISTDTVDPNVTTVPPTTIVTGTTFTYGTGACPPPEGAPEPKTTFDAAPMQCIDPAKTYTAVFDTTEGQIEVELDTTRTPGTVNNFVTLSRWKYYDGSVFFRTDTSIDIIQGGGKTNTDSPGYTIPDEGGTFTWTDAGGTGPFTYQAGDLVMARSAAPNSAGGQFFFGVGPNVANLDAQGTYVTFGTVTKGLDVLESILALNVDDPSSGLGGKPSRTVTVNSITITES
jgi:peptidylprolyl isomerase